MTAIAGKLGITKRPGELGIHSMDTFNMIVPDLKVAQEFYAGFGLDMREEGQGLGLFTFGSDHRWGTLAEGPAKKLNHLSFGAFEEVFDAMRRRIEANGVRILDAPRHHGFESNGFWIADPFGMMVEVKIAERSSPNEKSEFGMISVQRSQAPVVRPRRLAHLLVFTPSVPESIAFYSCNLGLRISDRSGDGICFMHGIHGSDHHLIAFAKSSAPALHHCFWDVSDINQIGMGAMQMADKGYSRGWGLGRHVLGSNYFHYVRDPWGSYSEYSADIDYIPLDHDWRRGTIRPRIRSICGGPRSPRISCIITRRMPAPATPRVAAPTDRYRKQYQEDQGKILAVTALPTASGAAPSMASSRAPGRFSKPFVGGATMARGPRNETPSLPDRGVMTPMRSSVTKLFRLRGGFQPDEHEGGKVMLKRSIATVLIGGKVLALGAMMSSTALAQSGEVIEGNTTVVETPSGSTVIVPGVAAEPSTPLGAVTEPGYPLLEQLDNDEEIARTLISQGFTDVHILREGPILTVNAQRGGQPIELVYSIANGSLISVDGVELRPAPDETGNGDSTTAATEDGTDPGDGAEDNGGDETGDGTGGEGDGGTGDDAGSDGSDGSDGETGGADGGDSGSDSGSDGGSDGGEGEGDSGESNG